MRRVTMWLAAFVAVAAMSTPCYAASRVVTPSKATGFWAGTRLKLVATRASSGRLRVHVEGTIAVESPTSVALDVTGCSAILDNISSYNWSPEFHPVDRQAVPDWPVVQQSGTRFEMRLRDRLRVSYSATVSYGYRDVTVPSWTDCVTLDLARRPAENGGADFSPAFLGPGAVGTLYVTVKLQDGRHVPCGPSPAFCLQQRPAQLVPPALPGFPPSPGLPGSPGNGDGGKDWDNAYHVCPSGQNNGQFVLCSADQAAVFRPR